MLLSRPTSLLAATLLIGSVFGLTSCYENTPAASTAPIPIEMTAVINGAQERPTPVNSPGSGTFKGNIDQATRAMSYTVTYSGITLVAGHLHKITMANGNGPVVYGFPTAGLASPIIGDTGPMSQPRLDSLLGGFFYVNLHTAANPGGEIRGDIKKK